MIIYSDRVLIGGALVAKYLVIEAGKISGLLDSCDEQFLDYSGLIISPGFVDVHYHGNYNQQIIDTDIEGFKSITTNMLNEGITSVLLTSSTNQKAVMENCMVLCGEYLRTSNDGVKAEVLGIHLEGPFLNPKFAGVHDRSLFTEPNIEYLAKLNELCGGNIKLVTYACEYDIDGSFQQYLNEIGVIGSIGHSNANYNEAEVSWKLGAKCLTHFYNGMSNFSHREPNLVGFGLVNDIYLQLISDDLHVAPVPQLVAYKCRGRDGILLITDSNKAKGLPPGQYLFSGRDVIVNELGEARSMENNSLAGSTLFLNKCVSNYAKNIGSLTDALYSATYVPAKFLGLENTKGNIVVGADADLLVIDENVTINKVIVKGVMI